MCQFQKCVKNGLLIILTEIGLHFCTKNGLYNMAGYQVTAKI